MFITLFLIITITFFLVHSIPGNPLNAVVANMPPKTYENFMAKYGLDKPILEQYGLFLKNMARGDLGLSLKYTGRTVNSTIATQAPVSGEMSGPALLLGFVAGIIMGIIAALNRNRWPDYVVMLLAIAGVTIPLFVSASLIQYLFAVVIPILPAAGWGAPKYMVLPVFVLATTVIAGYARFMRSSVLEVSNQDYILTAQAKGVSSFGVIKNHIIRNAILPCITMLAPSIGGVFAGSFIAERIFGIPGIGTYFITSIMDRDYTMILGLTIFFAAIFVLSLFVVDILYRFIDPRIRVEE
jgi:oligopeptide transport system permease protein